MRLVLVETAGFGGLLLLKLSLYLCFLLLKLALAGLAMLFTQMELTFMILCYGVEMRHLVFVLLVRAFKFLPLAGVKVRSFVFVVLLQRTLRTLRAGGDSQFF